jgi:hypothetical protein
LRTKGRRIGLDEDKVEEDRKFDGVQLLWSDTDLPVARQLNVYRQHVRLGEWWRRLKKIPLGVPQDEVHEEQYEEGARLISLLGCRLAARLEQKLSLAGLKVDWQEALLRLNEVWVSEVAAGGANTSFARR